MQDVGRDARRRQSRGRRRRIGPDEARGAKERTAKVTDHRDAGIFEVLTLEYVEDRPSSRPLGFAVVAHSDDERGAARAVGETNVRSVLVPLPDRRQHRFGQLGVVHGRHVGNKARFVSNDLGRRLFGRRTVRLQCLRLLVIGFMFAGHASRFREKG